MKKISVMMNVVCLMFYLYFKVARQNSNYSKVEVSNIENVVKNDVK